MLPSNAEEDGHTCLTCGMKFGGVNVLNIHRKVAHGQNNSENLVKSEYVKKETQDGYVVEKRRVAIYKHVHKKNFCITVNPQTQELVSFPNEQLVRFFKENGPISIKELIDSGVLKFVCICEMEVKKSFK